MFKRRMGKAFKWIKKHVRPDVGLTPFDKGDAPNFQNDDIYEIGDKLKKNLRVGLKLSFKF